MEALDMHTKKRVFALVRFNNGQEEKEIDIVR